MAMNIVTMFYANKVFVLYCIVLFKVFTIRIIRTMSNKNVTVALNLTSQYVCYIF